MIIRLTLPILMSLLYKRRKEAQSLVYQFNIRRILAINLVALALIVGAIRVHPVIGIFVVAPVVALLICRELLPFYLDQRRTLQSGKQYRRRRTGNIDEIWLEQ